MTSALPDVVGETQHEHQFRLGAIELLVTPDTFVVKVSHIRRPPFRQVPATRHTAAIPIARFHEGFGLELQRAPGGSPFEQFLAALAALRLRAGGAECHAALRLGLP